MLDPHDYTYLTSEMAVIKSDSLTLVTLPRPSGSMAYFRWRWVIRPVADAQMAQSLELSLNRAVRERMAGGAANLPTGKIKFQVLVDAVVAIGRCSPAGFAMLLPTVASCVSETRVPMRPVKAGPVSPAERARRHIQTQAVGVPSAAPAAGPVSTGHDHALGTGLSTLCVVGDIDRSALEAGLSILQRSPTPTTVDEGAFLS